MADVNRGNRPLSPFMIGPYYKPQLTSVSSIMVRITGLVVFGLSVVIIAWLLAASASETVFAAVNPIVQSWFGDLVLLAGVWCLTYHVLGRLRHVVWDFGYCWNVKVSESLAVGMFVGATVVAGLTFIAFLAT